MRTLIAARLSRLPKSIHALLTSSSLMSPSRSEISAASLSRYWLTAFDLENCPDFEKVDWLDMTGDRDGCVVGGGGWWWWWW
jgi:hypothetical protein